MVSQWIMVCITSVNTVVLVNEVPNDFFKIHRGLCQGCPVSPLLIILLVECLSSLEIQAVNTWSFQGLKVVARTFISHLFFVDDVLIFGASKFDDWLTFKTILTNFYFSFGMVVNYQKSCFLIQNID
jgi:hypothetical protein